MSVFPLGTAMNRYEIYPIIHFLYFPYINIYMYMHVFEYFKYAY